MRFKRAAMPDLEYSRANLERTQSIIPATPGYTVSPRWASSSRNCPGESIGSLPLRPSDNSPRTPCRAYSLAWRRTVSSSKRRISPTSWQESPLASKRTAFILSARRTLAALSVLPLEFGYFIIGQFHTVKSAKDRRKANIFRSNARGSDQMHSPTSGFKVEAVYHNNLNV